MPSNWGRNERNLRAQKTFLCVDNSLRISVQHMQYFGEDLSHCVQDQLTHILKLRFFLMFRVFREEIKKKSDIKYRIPSLSHERLNMDGVYQTFKTLRTVNQCLFTSILYIQVNTIKVTILRKKKI